MTHPFTRILYSALKKSTEDENLVYREAKKILDKGYSEEEVVGVLEELAKRLIDEREEQIVTEALLDITDPL